MRMKSVTATLTRSVTPLEHRRGWKGKIKTSLKGTERGNVGFINLLGMDLMDGLLRTR
jgi:hypothetical protein